MVAGASHQNLRRQGSRIIGRGHHRAIGAGTHHRHQVADFERRQIAALAKIIAAFANRADDVGGSRLGRPARAQRADRVIRFVKGWADQIVHRTVGENKIAGLTRFHQNDLADQYAGVANQETARFDR